jgi:hypothetical protein
MCLTQFFVNKMNIVRAYAKFLSLSSSITDENILNAPKRYIKFNAQEINIKTYFIFHNILNLKLCDNDIWSD